MHYLHDHKPLKNGESKHQKDSKAKKNYLVITNSNNRGGNRGQLSQAFGWSSKKDFCSNKKSQRGQSSNIPTTSSNATVVKNNKK